MVNWAAVRVSVATVVADEDAPYVSVSLSGSRNAPEISTSFVLLTDTQGQILQGPHCHRRLVGSTDDLTDTGRLRAASPPSSRAVTQ